MSSQKNLFQFFTKLSTPKSSSPLNSSTINGDSQKSVNGTPKSSKVINRNKIKNEKNVKKRSLSVDADNDEKAKVPSKRSRDDSLTRTFEENDEEDYESDSEENLTTSKKKRRRIVVASDSEDEYKPSKNSCSSDDSISSSEEHGENHKKKKKLKERPLISLDNFKSPFGSPRDIRIGSPSTSSPKGVLTESPLSVFGSNPRTPVSSKKHQASPKPNAKQTAADAIGFSDSRQWFHETLDWLKEDKIKDKFGKSKSDPNYNPSTLYVPDNFKKNVTPAMKQWWDLKSDYFDTVLFFKVGKFYELYHMDAVIGVKELSLTFMKGDWAHSGFPEIAFGRFSECLVAKGYKVSRVEQTETPQMMEERCKKMHRPTKYDKVVAREICQVTSKGTKTLTYQQENVSVGNDYLLAICEKHVEGAESSSEYGICFIDTSIGKFTMSQFEDDRHGSRILTLLALYPAIEVLYDKSSITKKTLQLLDNNLRNATKEANTQFWDSSKLLKFINENQYFADRDDFSEWPKTIIDMLSEDDLLHQSPKPEYELAFRSLGACIGYLKKCCIEDCILTMKLFEVYKPQDGKEVITSDDKQEILIKHMVLDGVTLQNLEIVPVHVNGNSEGTLLGTMDHCSTSFGKRLFRNWLCSPLYNIDDITNRLDAIDDLMTIPDVVEDTIDHLKKLPDLERILSKIHTYGLSRSKDHPESRAIFYEADSYNKTKILDFLSALEGFRETTKIMSRFEDHHDDFKSNVLKQCSSLSEHGGHFPNLTATLNYFDDAFDHDLAKQQGNIIPRDGVDSDYDTACKEISSTEKQMNSYLKEQMQKLGCTIKYVHSGKNRYLLEMPENKKPPSDFEFLGGKKGYKRYYSSTCKELLSELTSAEESRDLALRDCTKRIFASFDEKYNTWKAAVNCIATLDALISLLVYHHSSGITMCRPQFSVCDKNTKPILEIIDGRHPTFLKYFTGDNYIPNSVYIGPKREEEQDNVNNGGTLVLVTGPNMGGKSTLMRQAGVLLIMAHLGSYVPAESMRLSPVDRIFTRVGANDEFTQGESTFFVEASETASILHHASSNSVVLIDELGRGTSTYDGAAIASATLDYLANNIGCRTLFSTHYHSLVDDFEGHPNVGFGHMACISEKKYDCPLLEEITFLYKFINGACPKSYGFNVALLAGVQKQIVQEGFLKAQELELSTKVFKSLSNLMNVLSPEEIIMKLKL